MQISFFNNVNILVRHDCQIEKAVYGIVMLFPVKYQWFATAHNIAILFYKNKNKNKNISNIYINEIFRKAYYFC
jgi:hypothetical protein